MDDNQQVDVVAVIAQRILAGQSRQELLELMLENDFSPGDAEVIYQAASQMAASGKVEAEYVHRAEPVYEEEVEELDIDAFIARLADRIEAGESRDLLVEEMIQGGADPEVGQALWEAAGRLLDGRGSNGFMPWLRSKEKQRGSGMLVLLTLAMLPLFCFLAYYSIWEMAIFPEGRYPVLLLAVPALLVCAPIYLLLASGIFRWQVEPHLKNR